MFISYNFRNNAPVMNIRVQSQQINEVLRTKCIRDILTPILQNFLVSEK